MRVLRTSIVALAIAAPAAVAAPAFASAHVTVCDARAVLAEHPGGAAVGVVHHGDRVGVLQGHLRDRWIRVVTEFETRGWMHSSAVCGQ